MLLLSFRIAVASIVYANLSNTRKTLKRITNGRRKKRSVRSVKRNFARKRQNVFAYKKQNGNEKDKNVNNNASRKDFVKNRTKQKNSKNGGNSLQPSKRQEDKQNSMHHLWNQVKEHVSFVREISAGCTGQAINMLIADVIQA